MYRAAFILALSCGLVTPAMAGNWNIGIGGLAAPNPYIGNGGTKTTILPFFFYEGERFFVELDQAQYQVFDNGTISVGLIGLLRFQGYEPDDNAALAGMQRRNTSLDAGGSIAYTNRLGTLSFTALTDISDTHEGDELVLSWEIPFTVGKNWLLSPSVGMSWKSDDLIDYYYGVTGVTSREARPGRPAYQGQSSADGFVGLGVFYNLSSHWTAIAQFNYETLSKRITDSPIVEDDNQWYGFLGVVYEF